MPKFTIERTYDVPHYRHVTYEAATFEEALQLDSQNDNWDRQTADYETCSPERVTGAWAGDEAYNGADIAPKES